MWIKIYNDNKVYWNISKNLIKMIKNNTGFGFGELTIGLLILFAAFILFFGKKVFSTKRVKHYQLIDE